MLWIAVYLPELSLQIAQRSHGGEAPLVISIGAESRPIVHMQNDAARQLGIQSGMSIAAARTLTNELHILPRQINSENAAVHNLACWASQFTPAVVLQDEGLLLEVSTTLTLHGGLSMLLGKLRRGFHQLGYRISSGVAPTPTAAGVFAKARAHGYEVRICQSHADIEVRIADLPLALLDWPHEVLSKLASLGIVRFAECLALPAEGFAKRFGVDRWLDLQRILGRQADPRRHFIPPETYRAHADFGFEVDDAQALLFPLKRLLAEMEGYLRGRGAGVLEYILTLAHSQQGSTTIRIGMAKVERMADRLLALAREHLQRLELPDTVLALSIDVERLQPFVEVSESWLPNPAQQPDSWFRLLDKLSARLGPENVYQLQTVDDYRPEQSWKSFAATMPLKALNATRTAVNGTQRPMFLLTTPRKLLADGERPLCHGPIDIMSGPERIESGWWDGEPASRDYFVGRNKAGETMWLYRHHHDPASWFLHGYFA